MSWGRRKLKRREENIAAVRPLVPAIYSRVATGQERKTLKTKTLESCLKEKSNHRGKQPCASNTDQRKRIYSVLDIYTYARILCIEFCFCWRGEAASWFCARHSSTRFDGLPACCSACLLARSLASYFFFWFCVLFERRCRCFILLLKIVFLFSVFFSCRRWWCGSAAGTRLHTFFF